MLTPQPQAKKLARALGLQNELFLKREDLHPHGSHKGRSIPLMIRAYARLGWKDFCISSSGNAAISAALTIKEHNASKKKIFTLKIFVGKHIGKEKLRLIKKLLDKNISLQSAANPKQLAWQMDKYGLAKNLRQSTDDAALIGYASLAKELGKIKKLAAVFIPASSGATAQGLQAQFKKMRLNPQIHIVQTDACHPIADAVRGFSAKTAACASLAGAIVDKIAHRKEQVSKAVKSSRGYAWICSNAEIKKAVALVKKTEKINISPNSALAVAGLAQAIKNDWKFAGAAACVLTGK